MKNNRVFLRIVLLPALLFLTLLTPVFASSKPVTDDFITDSVRQKLASDSVVKGGAIDVIVKDHVVTLRGKVEEERQKARAEKLTKKINGVKSVVNEIQIAHP